MVHGRPRRSVVPELQFFDEYSVGPKVGRTPTYVYGPAIFFFLAGRMGNAFRRGNAHHQHLFAVPSFRTDVKSYFGLGKSMGSALDHVGLFFGTATRHGAVVANSNHQGSALSVRKSRECTRYFSLAINAQLKFYGFGLVAVHTTKVKRTLSQ